MRDGASSFALWCVVEEGRAALAPVRARPDAPLSSLLAPSVVCAQQITVENMESLVGQDIPVQFIEVNEVRRGGRRARWRAAPAQSCLLARARRTLTWLPPPPHRARRRRASGWCSATSAPAAWRRATRRTTRCVGGGAPLCLQQRALGGGAGGLGQRRTALTRSPGVRARVRASPQIGDVVLGEVQQVKPYGVFVDIGGMTGLLHVSQVSNQRITSVDKIFHEGDKLKVSE